MSLPLPDGLATEGAGRLVSLLRERRIRLVTAESCTGGLVSALVTAVAGSSSVFWGGVTSYDNEAKRTLLGVGRDTLAEHGAVSEETVAGMQRGAGRLCPGALSLAVSGIAGPGGGSEAKPVGTVWIAWGLGGREWTRCFLFSGDRDQVRWKAAFSAIDGAIAILEGMELDTAVVWQYT